MRILLAALSLLASLSLACAQGQSQTPDSPTNSLGRPLQVEPKDSPINTREGGSLASTGQNDNIAGVSGTPTGSSHPSGETKQQQEPR